MEIKRSAVLSGVHFGGNANNGSNAGLAYANSNNTPSNANANIGSQLCFTRQGLCLDDMWDGGLTSW